MRKYTLLLTVTALSLVLFGCSQEDPVGPGVDLENAAGPAAEKAALDVHSSLATYEVIVENLTPATGPGASQPFSPPILATHRRDMHIFQPGRYASNAVAQLAEDAVGGPLLDMLHGSSRVQSVAMGGGVIHPGAEIRLEIEARPGTGNLSLVFMLVNTNDAFGGLDAVLLPPRGEKVYMVRSWDAGSELNTELMSDIPGPCCGSPGMGTDEHEVIGYHMGITGVGDLSAAMYGWDEPVARVTVRRID